NETLSGMRRVATRNGAVVTGIDVLEQQKFEPILEMKQEKAKPNAETNLDGVVPLRIGLLTNQTGLDAQGRRTIDVFAATPGLQLKAIFSPEHGPSGVLDTTASPDSV